MTVRATKRGAERTSLEGERADVLVCGASFAGLAVARELAHTGADVLILDRYAIGERQTSACACPTPWLEAMGVTGAIRQELPYMSFTTPHGSVRYRLPWSWSSFDYRELCRLLFEQTDARFDTAKVEGRGRDLPGGEIEVLTDRGAVRAPLVVDALGWRRVLAHPHYQPPEGPLTRALEVHPPHDGSGDALDVWVERGITRRGYGWRVPAADEARIGACSYDPLQHVKEPTVALAARLGGEPLGFQGNWIPHRLRPAVQDGVLFVGDSAGHCFPLSAEGIRPAFYFGIAAGRELRAVLAGERSREQALRRYARFSAGHRHAFGFALRVQRLIPALPPRLLTLVLKVIGRQALVDRSFGWYLDVTPPAFAGAEPRPAAPAAEREPVAA
ncbi:MAG: NAD(P)/FAD-dependent oxidoreductase [Solirubrobacteraceae bacterium]|nr:NAD(P)/FAD-dependent oxidoreductase [Solirubrobacteraceae bacterium]